MKNFMFKVSAALVFTGTMASSEVNLVDLPAPEGPTKIVKAPADWEKAQAQRQNAKAKYLEDHAVAFDWFKSFPFSQSDGISMILLRLLPVVAPEIWGEADAFGSTFGLFPRSESDTLPLPVGIGVSGLDPKSDFAIDYTSFTCGACHIGRVKNIDGSVMLINGGVNAEFNIVKYFADFKKTLDQLGGETSGEERSKIITARFLQAAKDKSAADPYYFYGNAKYKDVTFDAAYEAAQVEAYLEDADVLTGQVISYIDDFVGAFSTYLDKTYPDYQAAMLAGLPGMADATGVSAAHGYEAMSASFVGRLFAKELLPDYPGLTDFMVIWNQKERTARWDSEGKTLIDGGGQYNGNIPIPIYRNLAASMTMGLKQPDLRVAGFTAELLGNLPPEPYPFAVDTTLAMKGETLFAENCAACHLANNSKVYRNLGTDPSRSKVINELLHKGALSEYLAVCNPETEITLYDKAVKLCAEFDGRPITKELIMRPLSEQYGGYNATALAGVWAAAPYLHTGSVPTAYHLLVPTERPDIFVKSALSYDKKHMGFSWQNGTEGGYEFDTKSFFAITNEGHDKDVTMDGKTYKLDWSAEPESAWAIIEYLKTL
jgi:hypothetical protein